MTSGCGQRGSLTQYEKPVWEPLLEAVGERLTGTFMWMHEEALEDGTRLHAYKHIHTRRYLYLDERGRAYEQSACDCFVPLRLDFALEAALCGWWILAGWDDEDAAAVREAIFTASEAVSG
ncbi:MAG: hypothetical protein ACRDL4_09740 [Thermoleophilaceae bacterium]